MHSIYVFGGNQKTKIYFVFSHSYAHILRDEQVPILINYAYLKKNKDMSLIAPIEIPSGFSSVLIDSGGFQLQGKIKTQREPRINAYSFWLQNEVIPNHPEVDGYMNLDIFGIDSRNIPIREKIDALRKGAESTLKNQELMESKYGLHPIPTWHHGEPEEFLAHYCKNYNYVAVGGIASLGTRSKTSILNLMQLTQKYPGVKFHLFGIGISGILAFKSLKPYSIDFSTWGVPARYGHDLVEDDKHLLKEVKLPLEIREKIRQDNNLEEQYLREAIRKIKWLQVKLDDINDPYQGLLF